MHEACYRFNLRNGGFIDDNVSGIMTLHFESETSYIREIASRSHLWFGVLSLLPSAINPLTKQIMGRHFDAKETVLG